MQTPALVSPAPDLPGTITGSEVNRLWQSLPGSWRSAQLGRLPLLEDVIERTALGCLDRGFGCWLAGHQDDRQVGFVLVKSGDDFPTRLSRQVEVCDHQVTSSLASALQTFRSSADYFRDPPFRLNHASKRPGKLQVIFDDKDRGRLHRPDVSSCRQHKTEGCADAGFSI